jgi:chitin synthase
MAFNGAGGGPGGGHPLQDLPSGSSVSNHHNKSEGEPPKARLS